MKTKIISLTLCFLMIGVFTYGETSTGYSKLIFPALDWILAIAVITIIVAIFILTRTILDLNELLKEKFSAKVIHEKQEIQKAA